MKILAVEDDAVARSVLRQALKQLGHESIWQQLEGYISERTGSDFSHSVCPDCYTRVVLPELAQLNKLAADSNNPTDS